MCAIISPRLMFCLYSSQFDSNGIEQSAMSSTQNTLEIMIFKILNFLEGKIMKKLLAMLIAGAFATVAFANEASAPAAATPTAKASASAPKKTSKHHAKKHHAKKEKASSAM